MRTKYEHLSDVEVLSLAYATLSPDDAVAFEILRRFEEITESNLAELEPRVGYANT